jgi:hypothetical protein
MKTLVCITVVMAFATVLRSATVIDENPGLLDDPACRGLIVAQLKAQNQTVADWIIEYNRTVMLPDNQGGMNIYRITGRKNNQVWEIAVAFHSEQIKEK